MGPSGNQQGYTNVGNAEMDDRGDCSNTTRTAKAIPPPIAGDCMHLAGVLCGRGVETRNNEGSTTGIQPLIPCDAPSSIWVEIPL